MARVETTPLRLLCAIAVGVLPAIVLTHLRTYAAFSALEFAEWVQIFLSHLQTFAIDFGPSFVLALIVWFVLDRIGLRAFWLAAVVGAVSFYTFPTLLLEALLFASGYATLDVVLQHGLSDAAVGGLLGLGMWAVAYRRPKVQTVAVFD